MQETIQQILEQKFRSAFIAVGIDSNIPVILQESGRPEFGDYQINGAMAAAKQLKQNPRELAQKIIDNVEFGSVIEKLELAGPGFINIHLADAFLAGRLGSGITNVKSTDKKNIVVDLSSPNLAKEMHVGHLRSTVIGDALARVNEFIYGEEHVLRQNHVGDWGTQFGMLILYMREHNLLEQMDYGNDSLQYDNTTRVGYGFHVRDLEQFYQGAKKRFDEDPAFAEEARACVVKLQNWDFSDELGKLACTFWNVFRSESLRHCQQIYDLLGVKLNETHVCGESFYEKVHQVGQNTRGLIGVIEELEKKSLLVESDGAKCVFLDGDDTPFMVQKNDGGYLYATTDLAAIDYRVNHKHADRVLYVVDARQSFHFKQLFAVAKKAGIAQHSELIHVPFGTMMGEDGKPFKTRTGGTVKLIDLINEAVKRATALVKERNPEWSDDEIASLGQILGVSAMKYADLSKNRTTDYIFSFDKMLEFEGNTAPYLLYAYTRINSIFLKAQSTIDDYLNKDIMITNGDEHKLALHIARFPDRLIQVARENYPHYLCSYIYELAVLFMKFYESSPILKEADLVLRDSRLVLAANTGKTLEVALRLLGIPVVAKM
ncbi:MAG: arginine--tRNA ligase [Neisseriales bacterium]|nr:MAG: arginine--tRNA ligase [Neisseriales bacterium]